MGLQGRQHRGKSRDSLCPRKSRELLAIYKVRMDLAYKKWLASNKAENESVLKQLQSSSVYQRSVQHTSSFDQINGGDGHEPQPSTSSEQRKALSSSEPQPSTSSQRQQASTSTSTKSLLQGHNNLKNASANKVSDLVFENEQLKLYIVSAPHRQEKRFRKQNYIS